MIALLICVPVTLAAILLLERLVKPKRARQPLFHRVRLLSVMPGLVFYVTIFMIGYRPIFAAGACILVLTAIVILNNSKYAALKEPLVFSDFYLLREIVNHPHLYVKYIGVINIIAVTIGAFMLIYTGIVYEPPIIERVSVIDYFPLLIYLYIVLGMIYAVTRGPFRGIFMQFLRNLGPKLKVDEDVDKLSLIACLIVYFFLANETPAVRPPLPNGQPAMPAIRRLRTVPWNEGPWPAVVAVQNESFFDARRLHKGIRRNLLSRWDDICERALYHGRLGVPAWGANTMRTEFGFLSGLPSEALGVNRFNPYLRLGTKPVWTLANHLKMLGYRTICVHPYQGSFFDRRNVFPNLGFDRFIDIQAFSEDQNFGPYVSDLAVADKIVELLRDDDAPQFIFAITMENHGKWEKERLAKVAAPEDLADPPFGSVELGLYLRHVANADAMAGRLVDALEKRPGEAVFCMYGDHLPSLPKVFAAAKCDDARTDYVIWRKGGNGGLHVDTTVDILSRLVIDGMHRYEEDSRRVVTA